MICPQCNRQLGAMKTCPMCKVATVEADTSADDRYRRGIESKLRRQAVKRFSGRLLARLIPLTLIAAFVAVLVWPVKPPPVQAPGANTLSLLADQWKGFHDKLSFGEPASFVITDVQLTAVARDSMKGTPPTIVIEGENARVWLPVRKAGIPFMVQTVIHPGYDKNKLSLQVVDFKIGLLPLGLLKNQLQMKLDELSPELNAALKDVNGMKFANGKITISGIPKEVTPSGQGLGGWIVIN